MKLLGWITSFVVAGSLAALGCSAMPITSSGPLKPTGVGTHPGGVLTSAFHGTLVPKKGDQLAMFAMGCFWGSEGTYRKVKGVVATAVGYSGGTTPNPTYEMVCTGTTHHAETVLVEFNPKVVTYRQLLEVFWASHDPTTLNQQGPDIGEQYRSAIFYLSPDQKAAAEATAKAEQKSLHSKLSTRIVAASTFYPAEDYHQQYAEKVGHSTCPPPRRPVRGVGMRDGE